MTREEAIQLYRELMQDLRETASVGLDMSPGDPFFINILADRALAALEAVIASLPNTAGNSSPACSPDKAARSNAMTIYYWENPVGTFPDHGQFEAEDDATALRRMPKTALCLYKEFKPTSETDNGLPFINSIKAFNYVYKEGLNDRILDTKWHPASEPPKQTEWVIASADGAVRCVAWNNDKHCWEDWDGRGAINLDSIDWWMPIPDVPAEEKKEDKK